MLGGLHVCRKVSPKYATGHICSYETEFREDSVPFMSYFENSLLNNRPFCKSSAKDTFTLARSPQLGTVCGCLHWLCSACNGYHLNTSFHEGQNEPRRGGSGDVATSKGSDWLTFLFGKRAKPFTKSRLFCHW